MNLYQSLFGRKNAPSEGSVIDMSEHGRVGGVSTGQPFKFVSVVDQITGTSNPLPTGAATSAKQDTANTLLGGIAGLLPSAYDYITYTSASTTDTYVFKTGGSGGTTVKTITITFTDTTKKTLSTVGGV